MNNNLRHGFNVALFVRRSCVHNEKATLYNWPISFLNISSDISHNKKHVW